MNPDYNVLSKRFAQQLQTGNTNNESLIKISNAEPWEYTFPLDKTCLIMIDFQRDFLSEGGFADEIVHDRIVPLRESIEPAKRMLEAARKHNMTVVHTLEAHLPDLSNCHDSKRWRVRVDDPNFLNYKRIGDDGPMGRILIKGEHGNEIIDELAPIEGEKKIYKPGKGAFYDTELDEYLKSQNITHMLFAGVTTDVCVQTTMREANDRGYNCLLLRDATQSFWDGFRDIVCKMVVLQDCVVGWVANVDDIIENLQKQSKNN